MLESYQKANISLVTENIITKPEEIANACNKYFVNISSTNQSNIISHKDINYFSMNPVNRTEIKNIILFLIPIKAADPSGILTKILKLPSNGISNQLIKVFNLSFSLSAFP